MEIKIIVISVYCKPLCVSHLHVRVVLSIKAFHFGEQIKSHGALSRCRAPVFSRLLTCFKVFVVLIAPVEKRGLLRSPVLASSQPASAGPALPFLPPYGVCQALEIITETGSSIS